MSPQDVIICGHGSGTPSLKNMKDYCASRYSQTASNGKHKGIVAVRRFKGLTDQNRQAFHDTYKTILGRNQYSQALRQYVYTPYHGTYYSDCSSSGCYTFRKIGLDCPDYNTAGIYSGNRFETVPIKIANGQITNPECLQVGDALLFVGNDPSRPLQIGHVEFVYEIHGGNEVPKTLESCVANVYKQAHNNKWPYGDCKTNPPCPPIACDRGIFRALWDWDPKFRDQQHGGETVYTANAYLRRKGAQVITKESDVQGGDIVIMKWTGSKAFHWKDHMWFCVSHNPANHTVCKYDFGSDERIAAAQPFRNVKFNEWPEDRVFYAAYRFPVSDPNADYIFTPKDVRAGSTTTAQYLANEILLAYDIKGINKNGKPQKIELNERWTSGDMCAMAQWKLDRLRQNGVNLCKGPYGAGEIGPKDWESLLSSGLPFHACAIPDRQQKGPAVLLAQRILKANGFKGKDGKPLALDAIFGENTSYAISAWQKSKGRAQTGKLAYDDWKVMLRNL